MELIKLLEIANPAFLTTYLFLFELNILEIILEILTWLWIRWGKMQVKKSGREGLKVEESP